jgi:hypothetical protein
MSIYRIIRIAGGIGYKVHVTNASSGLRVIGIFLTAADATDWATADREAQSVARTLRLERVPAVAMDGG